MAAWLLCSYRLPREPSRLRLAVWRRLKRLGAVMLHDGAWILPSDTKTREDFEWLAEEVEERGGSVLLWEARSLPKGQDAEVIERFRAEAADRLAAITDTAAKLGRVGTARSSEREIDKALQRLSALERTLRLERRRDYFGAPGRADAEQAVRAAAELLRARLARIQRRKTHVVGH